jgi:hypothetical protein
VVRAFLPGRRRALAERGIEVDHVTIYRWVQRFAPEFAEAARARRHIIGDRWHVDETYVKVAGTWRYLFRAIDQLGQVTAGIWSTTTRMESSVGNLVSVPELVAPAGVPQFLPVLFRCRLDCTL